MLHSLAQSAQLYVHDYSTFAFFHFNSWSIAKANTCEQIVSIEIKKSINPETILISIIGTDSSYSVEPILDSLLSA